MAKKDDMSEEDKGRKIFTSMERRGSEDRRKSKAEKKKDKDKRKNKKDRRKDADAGSKAGGDKTRPDGKSQDDLDPLESAGKDKKKKKRMAFSTSGDRSSKHGPGSGGGGGPKGPTSGSELAKRRLS